MSGPIRPLLRVLHTRRAEPPLLSAVDPAFARELEELLRRKGRRRLASGVAALRIVELCRCGDPRCASFYVIPQFVVRWRWPGHGETLQLDATHGTVSVDLVGGEIGLVEVLGRPELNRSFVANLRQENV